MVQNLTKSYPKQTRQIIKYSATWIMSDKLTKYFQRIIMSIRVARRLSSSLDLQPFMHLLDGLVKIL